MTCLCVCAIMNSLALAPNTHCHRKHAQINNEINEISFLFLRKKLLRCLRPRVRFVIAFHFWFQLPQSPAHRYFFIRFILTNLQPRILRLARARASMQRVFSIEKDAMLSPNANIKLVWNTRERMDQELKTVFHTCSRRRDTNHPSTHVPCWHIGSHFIHWKLNGEVCVHQQLSSNGFRIKSLTLPMYSCSNWLFPALWSVADMRNMYGRCTTQSVTCRMVPMVARDREFNINSGRCALFHSLISLPVSAARLR